MNSHRYHIYILGGASNRPNISGLQLQITCGCPCIIYSTSICKVTFCLSKKGVRRRYTCLGISFWLQRGCKYYGVISHANMMHSFLSGGQERTQYPITYYLGLLPQPGSYHNRNSQCKYLPPSHGNKTVGVPFSPGLHWSKQTTQFVE